MTWATAELSYNEGMEKTKKRMKRTGTAIVGGAVLVVGVIAIPYPGPGWLIVFAGLAILATEFTWAQRALDFARHKYDLWTEWLKRQHIVVRLLVLCITGLVVVTTMWLLNVFAIADNLFHLNISWLHSPLGAFK
jgi:uncharacterized protein (TIGR02611 family)